MYSNFKRFNNDIDYDVLVPPFGGDYYNYSPKQVEDNFKWFISNIPNRMDYFRKRCSNDLKISLETLDYSPESLVFVWKWFIKTARLEKTPKDMLEKMKNAAKVFGDSYINYEIFTAVTHFIIRDIGMYFGQCLVLNNPSLEWTYIAKKVQSDTINQPIISGFKVTISEINMPYSINPISIVDVCAANYLLNKQKETDLYDRYMIWKRFVDNS